MIKICKANIEVQDKGIVLIAINGIGNVDKQGDRSLKGSFNQSFKAENLRNVYFYKNHDTNETLGIPLKAYENDQYAIVEAKLNLDKEISRNAYSDYKFFAENESSVKHSVGVIPIKKSFDQKSGVTDVSEWKLKEFSFLTKEPANDNTPLLAIKENNPERFFEYLEKSENYLKWMMEKGLHTDEFIKEFEQRFKNLQNIYEQLNDTHIEVEQKEQPKALDKNYLEQFLINNL